MTNKSPRQRAESLLKIHEGACSVFSVSDITDAFREMQKEGLVHIEPSLDTASGMLTVREVQNELP